MLFRSLRQATGTSDPTPTSALLDGPRHEAVAEILDDPAPVFSHVFSALEHRLSPDAVFLDPARRKTRRRKTQAEGAACGKRKLRHRARAWIDKMRI